LSAPEVDDPGTAPSRIPNRNDQTGLWIVADPRRLFPATTCEDLPRTYHFQLGAMVAQGQDVARLDGLSTLDDVQDRFMGVDPIADGDPDRSGCAE